MPKTDDLRAQMQPVDAEGLGQSGNLPFAAL